MPDKIDLLFDDLQSRGYAKDKTRQQFRDYMLAPGKQGYENRKTFFEDFKSNGETDLGTYEDFKGLLGLHAVKKQSTKPANTGASASLQQRKETAKQALSGGTQRTSTPPSSQQQTPTPMQLPEGFGQLDMKTAGMSAWERENYAHARPKQKRKLSIETLDRAIKGDKEAAKKSGLASANQRMKDEMDYTMATGNRLENPVNIPFTAPTVARDENGEMVLGDDGQPLIGTTTDEHRVAQYQAQEREIERRKIIDPLVDDIINKTKTDAHSQISLDDITTPGGAEYKLRMENEATSPEALRKALDDYFGFGGEQKQNAFEQYLVDHQADIARGAARVGMSVDDFVMDELIPKMSDDIERRFGQTMSEEYSVKGRSDYFLKRMLSSGVGALVRMGSGMTPQQSRLMQEELQKTKDGEGTHFNAKWYDKAIGEVAQFAPDAPLMLLGGAAGGAATKTVGAGIKALGAEGLGTLVASGSPFLAANVGKAVKYGGLLGNRIIGGAANMGTFMGMNGALQAMASTDSTEDGYWSSVGLAGLEGFEEGAKMGTALGVLGMAGNKAMSLSSTAKGRASIAAGAFLAENQIFAASDYLSDPEKFNWVDSSLDAFYMMAAGRVSGMMTHGTEGMKRGFANILYGEPKGMPRLTADEKSLIQKAFGGMDFVKIAGDVNNIGKILSDKQNIPLNVRQKISGATMGVFEPNRPHTYMTNIRGNEIYERAKDGELLAVHKFADKDERDRIMQEIADRKSNDEMISYYNLLNLKNQAGLADVLDTFSRDYETNPEDVRRIMSKKPVERSFEEQEMINDLSSRLHEAAFPEGELHHVQSEVDGGNLAGSEPVVDPNVSAQLSQEVDKAFDEYSRFLQEHSAVRDGIDSLGEARPDEVLLYIANNYSGSERDEGMRVVSNYFNAMAKKNGYMRKVGDNINNYVDEQVDSNGFKGTLDGEPDEQNIITVTDGEINPETGQPRRLTLLNGEVGTRTTPGIIDEANGINTDGSRVIDAEKSGGQIICRDENGQFVILKPDSRISFVEQVPKEDFANSLREELGVQNTQTVVETGLVNPQAEQQAGQTFPAGEQNVPKEGTNDSQGGNNQPIYTRTSSKGKKIELYATPEETDQNGVKHVKIGTSYDGGEIQTGRNGLPISSELVDFGDSGVEPESEYYLTEIMYLPDGRVKAKTKGDGSSIWLKDDPLKTNEDGSFVYIHEDRVGGSVTTVNGQTIAADGKFADQAPAEPQQETQQGGQPAVEAARVQTGANEAAATAPVAETSKLSDFDKWAQDSEKYKKERTKQIFQNLDEEWNIANGRLVLNAMSPGNIVTVRLTPEEMKEYRKWKSVYNNSPAMKKKAHAEMRRIRDGIIERVRNEIDNDNFSSIDEIQKLGFKAENKEAEAPAAETQQPTQPGSAGEPAGTVAQEKIAGTSIDGVWYGPSKNKKQGTLNANQNGDVITFDIGGRKQEIKIDGKDWVTSDVIVQDGQDKTVGLSKEQMDELGIDKDSEFNVKRIFKSPLDGKWYADGYFINGDSKQEGITETVVELRPDFDLKEAMESHKEKRNRLYEGKAPAEIPTDKDGVKRYEQSGIDVDAAIEDLRKDQIDPTQMADAMISDAEETIKKIGKKKNPKPADIVKDTKARLDAKQVIDYWTKVRNRVAQQRADELARESAEREEQRRKAAEEAALQARQKQEAELSADERFKANRERFSASREEGDEDSIVLANGETIDGHYVLVEADAVTPSHNPRGNFAKSEGFPVDENGKTINDRDYENDKNAQMLVQKRSQAYDQRAVNTPVVVSEDGIVLSGNDRTMSGQLAAEQGTDKAYVDYIKKHAKKWGFTEEQISNKKNPRIVFVPKDKMDYNAETFAKFNQDEKKSQSKLETSVKMGKVLAKKPQTLSQIGTTIDKVENLSDLYSNAELTKEVLLTMKEGGLITDEGIARLTDENGLLSAQGKDEFETMLAGVVVDEDALRILNNPANSLGDLRKSIAYAVVPLVKNQTLGDYAIIKDVSEAVRLYDSARKKGLIGKDGDITNYFINRDAFEGAPMDTRSITQLMLANQMSKGGYHLKRVLEKYNKSAQPAANKELDWTVGGIRSKEDILSDILKELGYDAESIKERVERLRKTEPPVELDTEGRKGGTDRADDSKGKGGAEPEREPEPEQRVEGKAEGEAEAKPQQTEKVTPETVTDHIQINNTSQGLHHIFDINGWNRKASDIRTEADGWGEKNGLFYFKKSFKGGRGGDNVTIWFKEKPNEQVRQQIEQWLEKGKRLDETDVLAKILNGEKVFETEYSPSEEVKAATTSQQREQDEYLKPRNEKEKEIVKDVLEQLQQEIDAAVKERDKAASALEKARAEESDKATDMFSDDNTFKEKGQLFDSSDMPTDRSHEGVNKRTSAERERLNEAQEKLNKLQSEAERNSRIRGALDNERRQTKIPLGEPEGTGADPMEAIEKTATEFKKEQDKKIGITHDETPEQKADRENAEKLAATPITADEIDGADISDVEKTLAKAYLNGNQGFLQKAAYLKAYDNVRNRRQDGTGDSLDAEGRTQLDSGENQPEPGSGRTGGPALPVDETKSGITDEGQLRLEDGKGQSDTPVRERGDRSVSGAEPSVDGLSSGSEQPAGGRESGIARPDVRGAEPNKGSGKDTPKPAAGSDAAIAASKQRLAELRQRFKKAGRNGTTSVSLAGMNSEQIEILMDITTEAANLGYQYLAKGVREFKEWNKQMLEDFHDWLHEDMKWSDAEIDEYLNEVWNCEYNIDGVTRSIREWASLMGEKELRKQIKPILTDKREAQKAAESIEVKTGDIDNIRETLPFLLPEQQDDVLKAETQFFDEKHQDREHGNGKGMMFTNGTGTGKTYTGLGIVKRFVKQGKGRVLILTPSQEKVTDWSNDGLNLGLNVEKLDDIAKAKGTTATKSKGTGVVVTTYANARQNLALLEDCFDLIVYDESHKITEGKEAAEGEMYKFHQMLTNKDVEKSIDRQTYWLPEWIEYRNLIKEREENRKMLDNLDNYDNEETVKVDGNEINVGELRSRLNARMLEIENRFGELQPIMQEIRESKRGQAEIDSKRTKTVFLSATPFNTRENMKYAEGYLFSYPEEDPNTVGTYNHRSPEDAFFERYFPAGYRWRYGRLESHVSNAEALGRQEIDFSDYLQNQLGTLSGRMISSDYDYSRDFPIMTLDHAGRFNQAMSDVYRNKRYNAMAEAFKKAFDYNYSTALFEAMKTSLVIDRIKEHLKRGQKVVVFHRRRTSGDLEPPFERALNYARIMAETEGKNGNQKGKQEILNAVKAFSEDFADMLEWEKGLDYTLPRDQIAKVFGEDKIGFFSGAENKKTKHGSVEDFMKDNGGKDIIVIQEASGKEGISLHDQTGEHQRVEINLALPQSPIAFIQIEGRIYRIGQKSNAIFEYPLLGLDLETNLFAQKFNSALGTTENLALGSKARNLRKSIANSILLNTGEVDYDRQGLGGKDMDGQVASRTKDGFDDAINDYYGNQKMQRGRANREGYDYFPTPEPVGFKMVEWGQLMEGESALEPSAGHGAIARYVPETNALTAIEPSADLFSKLQMRAGGPGRRFEEKTFEDYPLANKHDVIVMNPPYGTQGKMAMEHVEKAFKHLNEGGRLIAIIPDGPSMERRLDAWLNSTGTDGTNGSNVLVGEVKLPDVAFGRAGTNVRTRIVVIDKVSRAQMREGMPDKVSVDLSGAKTVEDMFEQLRHVNMPERTIDQAAIAQKQALKTKKAFEDNKFARDVDVDEHGISVGNRSSYGSVPSLRINFDQIDNPRQRENLLTQVEGLISARDNVETLDYGKWKNKTYGSGKNAVPAVDAIRDYCDTAIKTIANVLKTTPDGLEKELKAMKAEAERRRQEEEERFRRMREEKERARQEKVNAIIETAIKENPDNETLTADGIRRNMEIAHGRDYLEAAKAKRNLRNAYIDWETGHKMPNKQKNIEEAYNEEMPLSLETMKRLMAIAETSIDANSKMAAKRALEMSGIHSDTGEAKEGFDYSSHDEYYEKDLREFLEKASPFARLKTKIQESEEGKPSSAVAPKPAGRKEAYEYKLDQNTKTGADMHLVVMNERVDDATYKDLQRKAKALNDGYYNRFKKAWHFKTEEDARKFMEQAGAQNGTRFSEEPAKKTPKTVFSEIVDKTVQENGKEIGKINNSGTKFKEEKRPVFESNAHRAVVGIKQEKATPEQWLKMIEKNGGLKAGEDKWMGLSEWLKGQDKKSLTKQEVLDFIRENQIQIEEVNYADQTLGRYDEHWDYLRTWLKENTDNPDAWYNTITENYGYRDGEGFSLNQGTRMPKQVTDMVDRINKSIDKSNPINTTRLSYTTKGLENKKEIALVVPTVESWNKGDEIHFGDAGDGRAVAWVRFGETTTNAKSHASATNILDELEAKYGTTTDYSKMSDEDAAKKAFANYLWRNEPDVEWMITSEIPSDVGKERADNVVAEFKKLIADNSKGERVLVIDEIQSKRHQEGREKGYRKELPPYTEDMLSVVENDGFWEIGEDLGGGNVRNLNYYSTEMMSREEAVSEYIKTHERIKPGVPDAPFEKNWHELAMKRMLRYAAENGYDKVAWTKGEQQAERYDIGNSVKNIISYDYPAVEDPDGRKSKKIEIRLKDGDTMTMRVNEEGTVIEGRWDTKGKNLSDVVGKDLAVRIMGGEGKDGTIFDANKDLPAKVIEGEGLRIGGEGMKGFYDQMLPRFMDKYGKKWGVKTGEVELPNVEEAGRKMWSVDVTPEMKESVMEGQTMFKEGTDVSGLPEHAQKIVHSIEKTAKKLNTPVKIARSIDEVTNKDALKALREGRIIKGWFEEGTGEIVLYLPNIADKYSAMKTVAHEVVGHNGLRALLGEEGYRSYMRTLWLDMKDESLSDYIKENYARYGDIYTTIDEYLAEAAEKGYGNLPIWQKVRDVMTDALRKAGFEMTPSISDVKYMVWLSKNQLENNDPMKAIRREALLYRLGKEKYEAKVRNGEFSFDGETAEHQTNAPFFPGNKTLFRSTPSAKNAKMQYEKALSRMGYVWKESHIDQMQAAIELMRAISGVKKIEDIPSVENFVLAENQMSSKEEQLDYLFNRDYMQPLDKAVGAVLPNFGSKTDDALRNLQIYMVKKSGLERNRCLFVRDKIRDYRKDADMDQNAVDKLEDDWNQLLDDIRDDIRKGDINLREYLENMDAFIKQNIDPNYKADEHDYSGLTAMTGSKKGYDDNSVIDDVMNTESRVGEEGIKNLWEKTKAVSQYGLDMEYEGGLDSKEKHDKVSKMFEWYVPMRGYDETRAEEVYDYLEENKGSEFVGPVLMNAKGRESQSDVDIFAQLGAMSSNAVNRALKNQMKQAFARFVRNHYDKDGKDRLVTELKYLWGEKRYDQQTGQEYWEEVFPDIPENASADQVAKIVEDFENDMKAKEATGDAKRMRQNSTIPFRPSQKNKSQHIVEVYINGEKKTFIVNGNPRAAQAINGQLKSETNHKIISRITRMMAQLNTSYNPDFVVGNTERDYIFSSAAILAKESPKYFANWQKNYFGRGIGRGVVGVPAMHTNLFKRYREGNLDMNNPTDRYFKEFMENGGETGWVEQKNLDKWRKEIKKGVKAQGTAEKAGRFIINAIPEAIEAMNERAENAARFATYMTSRQMGRSITRSVSDAKEVSVNFNRKGAGLKTKDFAKNRNALQRMNAIAAARTAQFGQDYIMFYNAGVQGLNNASKILRDHPIKASTIFAGFALGAFLMSNLNQSLIDDEDPKERGGIQNPYAELPEWIRRNRLCLYVGKGEFVTVDLPIELRALYGIGDIAAAYTTHPELRSQKPVWQDVMTQMTQVLPIDFMGEHPGEPWMSFVPSFAMPFAEVAMNQNWYGRKIEKDQYIDENDPRWTRAYKNANKAYIDASKGLNAGTNRYSNEDLKKMGIKDADINKVDPEFKGSADGKITDPAIVEHIVNGYFGGAGQTAGRLADIMKGALQGESFGELAKSPQMPILRRLHYSPTEQNKMARTRNKWWHYKDEMDNVMNDVKVFKEYGVTDPLAKMKQLSLEDSVRATRAALMQDAQKQYKKLKKLHDKMEDGAEKDDVQMRMDQLMENTVRGLDNISK